VGIGITRGTLTQLRVQKKLVDGYWGGEAARHEKAGISCVDCRPLQCNTACQGIRSDKGLTTYAANLRRGIT